MEIKVSLTNDLPAVAASTETKLTAKEKIAAKVAALDKAEESAIKESLKSIKAKYAKMRANVRKGLPAYGKRPTK